VSVTARRHSDPQAWVEDEITSRDGSDITFEPVVTAGGVAVTAAWTTAAGPTRTLRTTLYVDDEGANALPAGRLLELWLVNPAGPDVKLDHALLTSG
jgi:hypothetical protein